MSNFIVNTDIPNLRVLIREGDQYNINVVPGRITTVRTGSFNTYADYAVLAATASYISGAAVFAASSSYASVANTVNPITVIDNHKFPIAFISGSYVATDLPGHLKFNPYTHTLSISGSTGVNEGITSISARNIFITSGNSTTVVDKHGFYSTVSGSTIGLTANPSTLFTPSLSDKENPGIVITSQSSLSSGYVPLEFQGSGSYTDGRVTVNTPLVSKQGINVTGSVISDDFQLKAGQVTITFTGSVSTGIFGVSEYVQPFVSTQSYSGASIEYIAQRPGATRMGMIMATWTGDSNIAFTDFSTADVGDTEDISFIFLPSGSYYRLRVNSAGSGSGTWTVQTLFKLFPNLI